MPEQRAERRLKAVVIAAGAHALGLSRAAADALAAGVVGAHRASVARWRKRAALDDLADTLADRPRSGRPRGG